MLNIGPQELIVVLIIALVVVGPNRLPELGRSIGRALKEFRKIQDDVKDTIKFDLNADHEPYVAPKGKSPTASPDTPTVGTDSPNGGSPAPAPVEPDAPPRAAE